MRNWVVVLAAMSFAALNIGCSQLKARDQLNKGVQAFTAARDQQIDVSFRTHQRHRRVATGPPLAT